jgi:hypothetical protein
VRSTNGQQVYVTILNIPDHQGNANANHDKMSSPPKSDFYQQHSGMWEKGTFTLLEECELVYPL